MDELLKAAPDMGVVGSSIDGLWEVNAQLQGHGGLNLDVPQTTPEEVRRAAKLGAAITQLLEGAQRESPQNGLSDKQMVMLIRLRTALKPPQQQRGAAETAAARASYAPAAQSGSGVREPIAPQVNTVRPHANVQVASQAARAPHSEPEQVGARHQEILAKELLKPSPDMNVVVGSLATLREVSDDLKDRGGLALGRPQTTRREIEQAQNLVAALERLIDRSKSTLSDSQLIMLIRVRNAWTTTGGQRSKVLAQEANQRHESALRSGNSAQISGTRKELVEAVQVHSQVKCQEAMFRELRTDQGSDPTDAKAKIKAVNQDLRDLAAGRVSVDDLLHSSNHSQLSQIVKSGYVVSDDMDLAQAEVEGFINGFLNATDEFLADVDRGLLVDESSRDLARVRSELSNDDKAKLRRLSPSVVIPAEVSHFPSGSAEVRRQVDKKLASVIRALDAQRPDYSEIDRQLLALDRIYSNHPDFQIKRGEGYEAEEAEMASQLKKIDYFNLSYDSRHVLGHVRNQLENPTVRGEHA